MGHTIGTHSKSYRLPTVVTAKIAMLMETGEAEKYKEMTLEEIQLPMDEEIEETKDVEDPSEIHDLFQYDTENHEKK